MEAGCNAMARREGRGAGEMETGRKERGGDVRNDHRRPGPIRGPRTKPTIRGSGLRYFIFTTTYRV